jgi:hypothetical protein
MYIVIYRVIFVFQYSTIKFHIIALKCGECGSYNTSRDDDAPLNAAVAALLMPQNIEIQAEQEDIEDIGDDEMGIPLEMQDDDNTEDTSDGITDDDSDNDNASVGSDLSLD